LIVLVLLLLRLTIFSHHYCGRQLHGRWGRHGWYHHDHSDDPEYPHHGRPKHPRPPKPELDMSSSKMNVSPFVFAKCDPSIPMDKPIKVRYDPEEYPSLSLKINGPLAATNFMFEFHEEDDNEVYIRAEIKASEKDLLHEVDVVSRGDDDGYQHFIVNTPKLGMPNKCLCVNIVVSVPKKFTYFRDLHMAYFAGTVKFSSDFKNVHYGKLFIGAVNSDLKLDQTMCGERINLDVVRGHIKGNFNVKQAFQAAVVRGNMDVCIDMKTKDEVEIMVTTIHGDINLDVSKHFAGSFYAGNMRGDVGVVGDDIELDVDKNHRKQGVHIPPDVDEKDAKSMIRATSVKGDVEVNFV